jgi:hypothetical protein
MDKKEGMNRWKSALLLGGGLAVALLWGCFNPIMTAPDPGSENQGSENPGPADPNDEAAGEFTVVLRVGEGPEVPESRSVVGPGAEDIPYSGVCNTVQVIAVDAETQKVADNQQVQETENDSKTIWVNIAQGKRYHFLVLMGHSERNYEAEKTSGGKYVYKSDPPTLLAAGFLEDQSIHGQATLSVTMKPLVVDTVFKHGGSVTQAALPKTQLPSGTAARMVWTVSGGFATLVDAQTRAGLPGGLNWGGLTLEEQETILRLSTDQAPAAPKPAVLGGEDRNQIVLDLGAPNAGTSGSANFRLTYNPLGEQETWIIRNGVNDLAQDGNTTFTINDKGTIPWDETANGNGAVAFEFADQKVSLIDLTDLLPVPVAGQTPPKLPFSTSQYTRAVTWYPSDDPFLIDQAYTATVTLTGKEGFFFGDGVEVVHSGASSTWEVSKADAEVVVKVFFPKTGAAWEYGGYYFSGSNTGEMDSAIDAIRAAQEAGMSSLSLKLVPGTELAVDLSETGRDIGGGLVLNEDNSPAVVILDGGSRTIPLTGGKTGSVITVGSGVTLTLRNITFVGLTKDKNGATTNNKAALIKVETGGTLILEDGAVITGNTAASGGGVQVVSGTFIMSGGTISGNTVTDSGSGGGVQVAGSGTFTMRGGTISDNKGGTGGGVRVTSGGTFTMEGGTISGNMVIGDKYGGGGVYVVVNGTKSTFTKTGGIIYGNVGTPLGNKANTGNGHAAYVFIDGNTAKKRDATADENVDLHYPLLNDATDGNWTN